MLWPCGHDLGTLFTITCSVENLGELFIGFVSLFGWRNYLFLKL